MDLSTRHGQIGGLNERMESVVDHPEHAAPIFEFRDLEALNGGSMPGRMGEYEDKAVEMHKLAKTDGGNGASNNKLLKGRDDIFKRDGLKCKPK